MATPRDNCRSIAEWADAEPPPCSMCGCPYAEHGNDELCPDGEPEQRYSDPELVSKDAEV